MAKRQTLRFALLAGAAATALIGAGRAGAQDAEDGDIAALDGGAAPPAAAPTKSRSAQHLPLQLPVRESAGQRGANLFAARSWFIPPPPPPPAPVVPPPPPTAPPVPFTLVGSFAQGGETVYFLVHGDRSYDVKVGDVVEDTYRVDGVDNGQMALTYLPLNEHQTLPFKPN
jgi:hypothetical protein